MRVKNVRVYLSTQEIFPVNVMAGQDVLLKNASVNAKETSCLMVVISIILWVVVHLQSGMTITIGPLDGVIWLMQDVLYFLLNILGKFGKSPILVSTTHSFRRDSKRAFNIWSFF